ASPDGKPSEDIEIRIHDLTAVVSLGRPMQELIPERYLHEADRTSVLERLPWMFRRGLEDATDVDVDRWSPIDVRYRGVYRSLSKAPPFPHGLYDNADSIELIRECLDSAPAYAQRQAAYALFEEILRMLCIKRRTYSEKDYFHLRPRLLTRPMEYMTGRYRTHHDGPDPAGALCLDFFPSLHTVPSVVPVSITTDAEPLESALTEKIKLILGQLNLQARILRAPGDKIPDQEVFVLAFHGSRLHILHAEFPGDQISTVWCERGRSRLRDKPEATLGTDTKAGRDAKAFHVKVSNEYNLWMKADYLKTIRAVAGLVIYLMSGTSRCGVMQTAFHLWPYHPRPDRDEEAYALRREQALHEQLWFDEEEVRIERRERLKQLEHELCDQLRDSMRYTAADRIGGINERSRPWWNWVWSD
ncbi:hypothetical protein ASPZODRAFT_29633, partial [Penicilliopsis zonata CBS 506.65]